MQEERPMKINNTHIWITPSEESFILNELLPEYLRVTANFQGSLFCHFGGKFLTAYQFAQMLISVGIDLKNRPLWYNER
jgi:hypothetical protein